MLNFSTGFLFGVITVVFGVIFVVMPYVRKKVVYMANLTFSQVLAEKFFNLILEDEEIDLIFRTSVEKDLKQLKDSEQSFDDYIKAVSAVKKKITESLQDPVRIRHLANFDQVFRYIMSCRDSTVSEVYLDRFRTINQHL